MATEQFSAPAPGSEALHSGIPLTFLKYFRRQMQASRLQTSSPAAPGPTSLATGPGLRFAINNEWSGLSRKRPVYRHCRQRRLRTNFTKTPMGVVSPSGKQVGAHGYADIQTYVHAHTHICTRTSLHTQFSSLLGSLWPLPITVVQLRAAEFWPEAFLVPRFAQEEA